MKLNDNQKKEVLIKAFDVLKSNFEKNQCQLGDIVIKMFNYDTDMGLDMWKYLLEEYKDEVKGSNFITASIGYGVKEIIGESATYNLILNDPLLKKSFFEYGGDEYAITYAAFIVNSKIRANELQEANELLELLYHNPCRSNSWYDVMTHVLPGKFNVTDEAYEFLNTWCDKVEDEEERTKLNLMMLDYV